MQKKIKRHLTNSLVFMLLAFLVPISANAQIQDPVSFTVTQQLLNDDTLEVVFTGCIDFGWHVYGIDIAEGGPTRTELTIETIDGLEPIGNLEVRSEVKTVWDKLFDMNVSFIEDEALFVQKFKIISPIYSVSGYLTYGACNDENCIPPADVDFAFSSPDNIKKNAIELIDTECEHESASINQIDDELWAPVDEELLELQSVTPVQSSDYLSIFLLGLAGGFIALLTPCVWPIIPMTVSFFLKRSKSGIRDAMIYGASIVAIYVLLGLFVTLAFGASALNALSTNAFFNICFFIMLVMFGASFLGGFELALPGRWSNAIDRKSESSKGLYSIFLMAFTLALVSFSCTGPIIGFLLVQVAQSGSIISPTIGMFGFAIALALPFTLFALFPAWLKTLPRSGDWMNRVKVSLGFIELAFALKFFSVADLAYGWHLLDREVFLCLWIVLFAMLGSYLIDWIRFPHDEDVYDDEGNIVVNPRVSVPRFFFAVVSFAFALYMVPGLWGAPCKAVSAFAPPMNTQDFNLNDKVVEARFNDYDEGMRYAKEHKLPVMLDFTGYGCVNCRQMEASVWTDDLVRTIINERYVLITLYVDDKQSLPETIEVNENGSTIKLRTIGDKWSYLQRNKFGANAQPFYVLLDNNGKPLTGSYSFSTNVEAFRDFLDAGLKAFASR